jgi:hypothetical protein
MLIVHTQQDANFKNTEKRQKTQWTWKNTSQHSNTTLFSETGYLEAHIFVGLHFPLQNISIH